MRKWQRNGTACRCSRFRGTRGQRCTAKVNSSSAKGRLTPSGRLWPPAAVQRLSQPASAQALLNITSSHHCHHTHLLLPVHTRTRAPAHIPLRNPQGAKCLEGLRAGDVPDKLVGAYFTSFFFPCLPFPLSSKGGGTDIKAARGVGGEENALPKIGPIKTEA